MSKLTGKAGSFAWNSATIPITKAGTKGNKTMADSTDSSNYDSGTSQLYKSQLPGDVQLELDIEGYFDTAQTGTTIISALTSDSTVTAAVKLNGTSTLCSGTFDLSNWECNLEVPGGTMVTFTATLMSNGIFTLNA
jgi:hypothetical protein